MTSTETTTQKDQTPADEHGESSARIRILRMVQEGAVTPEEGVKLLEALTTPAAKRPFLQPHSDESRFINVRITAESGEQMIIRIPLTLLYAAARAVYKLMPEGIIAGNRRYSVPDMMTSLEGHDGDILDVSSPQGDQLVLRVE